MAHLTRFNRKAALLLAKIQEMGYKDGKKKVEPFGKKTVNAVRNWRISGVYKDAQEVSEGLKTLLDIKDNRNLFSDDVGVKEFAHLLGYSTQKGREIIDQAFSELFPAYPIFYSSQNTAKEIFDRFHGLYLVYRIDSGGRVKQFTGREMIIVQMPLTVRYILKGTKKTATSLFRVRCKFTVPSYTVSKNFFEYDGYITPQEHDTHYWLFENRSEENKDLIFMITDSLEKFQEYNYAQGIMVTRRQDVQRTHKIWKVLMLKVNENNSEFFDPDDTYDNESKFMVSQCKILSEDEVLPMIIDILKEKWEKIDILPLL